MDSREDILVEDEEWLDRLNLTFMVLDGEIPIIEFRVDRVFDNFVIATILVLRGKSALPMPAILQLVAREDIDATSLAWSQSALPPRGRGGRPRGHASPA